MKRKTTEEFVKAATLVHGTTYDYSRVVYTRSHSKVRIICPTHGEFEQLPYAHTHAKNGCPCCAHNLPHDFEYLVNKSKELFSDQYTIGSNFTGMMRPVQITCKYHGPFTIKVAGRHLRYKGCCPRCAYLNRLEKLKPGNISKQETRWLDSLNVPLRQHRISVGSLTFLVDGYDPITNTVYEFYGSYWHGNPVKYHPDEYNSKIGKTFGEIYSATVTRENTIRQHYSLVTKWN